SWSRMLAERASTSPLPLAGIVHLWALDEADGAAQECSLEASLSRLCGSTLSLVQALMDMSNQRMPRLWLGTRGAQAILDGEAASVRQTVLWGLGRTLAYEQPSLSCTCVDMDSGEWSSVMADLLQPDGELQTAYRNGERYVARLQYASTLQLNG